MNPFIYYLLALMLVFGLGSSLDLKAQRLYTLHWVGFKDKANSPYSVFQPQAYLSPRAIARRQAQGILIDSTDLPPNPHYLQALAQIKGVSIFHQSRWLNGAVVRAELKLIPEIEALSFVRETKSIGFARNPQKIETPSKRPAKPDYRKRDNYYGLAQNQIEMLNVHWLHRINQQGQGLHIAIMDGGFTHTPTTPSFDSLFIHHRILGTWDFVENDEYVYEASDHGRDVLACMGANLPYLLVGTAPQASFYLFKTEDELAEYPAEEYHWIAAAEKADSLGVDVFNTSLGYYDYDDNMMDYAYVDLDGRYTPIALASDMAARKGILVVCSAGNEGRGKWKHITTPADANLALTVGAVNREGEPADFSSEGFPDRPRIKPNLSARGDNAIVAAPNRYDIRYQSGTSFSSPILAGAVTALWQGLPWLDPQTLIFALEAKASHTHKPDLKRGYGVPDLLAVQADWGQNVLLLANQNGFHHLAPHPKAKGLHLLSQDLRGAEAEVELRSIHGLLFYEHQSKIALEDRRQWSHEIPQSLWESLPQGLYFLQIRLGPVLHRVYLVK